MKEIRLHGRGGQGLVTGSQIIVKSIIEEGKYAHFIPYFGVERKGSPVFGFLRIDEKNDIREKCQVYEPDCIIVLDDTLISLVPVFDGFRDEGFLLINTTKNLEDLNLPESYQKVGLVDATGISLRIIKRNIPNSAMLACFAKTTQWCDFDILLDNIEEMFGKENRQIALEAYEKTVVYTKK
jgi:2-oxoacid:acceptor oxidoreductase gamma subunit (pyruvate/2-ketoisovalerate family)